MKWILPVAASLVVLAGMRPVAVSAQDQPR